MNANEAPEKIYIVNDDLNIKREWYKTKQVGFETTEYTRTDAFIEKADKFISTFFHPDDKELIDEVLKVFHKHMKGE